MNIIDYISDNLAVKPVEPAEPKRPIILEAYSKEQRDEYHRAKLKEIFNEYARAIKATEQARITILKGLDAAENPYKLLWTACEALGDATGDKAFKEQAYKSILAVYGKGLQDKKAASLELAEIRERLQMLTRPQLQAEPPETRRRINEAIKAHRAKEAAILAMM